MHLATVMIPDIGNQNPAAFLECFLVLNGVCNLLSGYMQNIGENLPSRKY